MHILTQHWIALKSNDLVAIKCDYCQTIFTKPKHRLQDKIANNITDALFCSTKCSSASRSFKIRTTCFTCQKQIAVVKSEFKTHNFCSKSCAAKSNNLGNRRWSKPDSPYSLVKRCKTCGKISKNFYCSKECNPRRILLSDEDKKKRSRAMHNEAWHRYMAKRKNQTPSIVDFKAIQQFYINCPNGYEVDHIKPISKGGLHTLENLQYLTIEENRKKSNKWQE